MKLIDRLPREAIVNWIREHTPQISAQALQLTAV